MDLVSSYSLARPDDVDVSIGSADVRHGAWNQLRISQGTRSRRSLHTTNGPRNVEAPVESMCQFDRHAPGTTEASAAMATTHSPTSNELV